MRQLNYQLIYFIYKCPNDIDIKNRLPTCFDGMFHTYSINHNYNTMNKTNYIYQSTH